MGKGGSVPCMNYEMREVLQCPKTRRGIPVPFRLGGYGDAGQADRWAGKIPPAGSVTCSTWSATRTSWRTRGIASGEQGRTDSRH